MGPNVARPRRRRRASVPGNWARLGLLGFVSACVVGWPERGIYGAQCVVGKLSHKKNLNSLHANTSSMFLFSNTYCCVPWLLVSPIRVLTFGIRFSHPGSTCCCVVATPIFRDGAPRCRHPLCSSPIHLAAFHLFWFPLSRALTVGPRILPPIAVLGVIPSRNPRPQPSQPPCPFSPALWNLQFAFSLVESAVHKLCNISSNWQGLQVQVFMI
jgi:hypothetical protein